MVESGQVPEKGIIRTSTEKLSWRVPENGGICVSTEKGLNPGDYRAKEESLRVSKKCSGEYQKMYNPCEYRKTVPGITEKGSNLCEYQKMLECGRVPQKCRIRTSFEKLSRQVTKKGRISVSTEKW